MPTRKVGIRIPRPRWAAVQDRAARRFSSDGSKVVNAALEAFLAGELDAILPRWLAGGKGAGRQNRQLPGPPGSG